MTADLMAAFSALADEPGRWWIAAVLTAVVATEALARLARALLPGDSRDRLRLWFAVLALIRQRHRPQG